MNISINLRAAAVPATLIAFMLLVGSGCPGPDANPGGNAGGGLNADQKRRADQFISVFENSTIVIQYAYVENINDGRGFTAGRAGFTTATGDALLVVERYTAAVPGNELAVFLPRLRVLAAANDPSTAGLDGYPAAWMHSADDPQFRAAQDSVSDEQYYQPAVVRWRDLGLQTALSLAELYDAIIQHGEGDDPDGLPALIDRANARAGGTPNTGIAEATWISAFLDVRRATLEFATDPATREGWAASVDRVDAMRAILNDGNFNLDGPIIINTPDQQATIP